MHTYEEVMELRNQITKAWRRLVEIDATYANISAKLVAGDLQWTTATEPAPFVAFCAGNAIVDSQSLKTIR